jgi:hypothetical protein
MAWSTMHLNSQVMDPNEPNLAICLVYWSWLDLSSTPQSPPTTSFNSPTKTQLHPCSSKNNLFPTYPLLQISFHNFQKSPSP